jgi:hypothetical protein
MLTPIKLSHVPSKELEAQQARFLEQFSLDFDPLVLEEFDYELEVFNEAVFANGREKMKPIEDQFQLIKNKLDEILAKDKDDFKPLTFVRDKVWKDLEDKMIEVFGFRNVDILHWNEGYNSKTNDFDTMQLNCYTYPSWRYPIDGLVTDNGFYDTTRSISTTISYSLGVIKQLDAKELTAIFLHELGHNIDPALVDISYVESNILSKYLTDREGSLTTQEKKIANQRGGKIRTLGIFIAYILSFGILALIKLLIDLIKSLLFDPEKAYNLIKESIRQAGKYDRRINGEAFADNFARMYGYGAPLMSGFQKVTRYYDKRIQSRIKKEKARQKIIAEIILYSIEDKHGTDMHRAYSLIREYEQDLKNPDIPDKVKSAIKEDMEELKRVVDAYVNSGDKFSNRINKMILEELEKMDAANIKRDTKNKSDNKQTKPSKDEPDKSSDEDIKENLRKKKKK